MITVAILRAAGIAESVICRVLELEKQEFSIKSRESSRLRALRYRERKKANEIKRDVTFQNVTGRDESTKTNEIKRDVTFQNVTGRDESTKTLSFLESSSGESLKKEESPSIGANPEQIARGTRLPKDWKPSQADIEFARGQIGQQWHVTADSFRDYWRGAPGAKGRKSDWSATWRNWCRREAERAHKPNGKINGNGAYVPMVLDFGPAKEVLP
jgi:hypothetical protein